MARALQRFLILCKNLINRRSSSTIGRCAEQTRSLSPRSLFGSPRNVPFAFKSSQLKSAESALQKMNLIAPMQIGRRKHVLHKAVLCAKADLLAANGLYEEAETNLLNELEDSQPHANFTLIKEKLSGVYTQWGNVEKAAKWDSDHKPQIDPVILDELLRKYVEYTRE